MRAKEKLIAQANKLAYATDIKKILSDLLPLRLDKEATENYYNNVLTPDIRKQNYVLQLKMHKSKNAMQTEIPTEEHYNEEISEDTAKEIRKELFSIISEDCSFGYLYYLLGTEQNARKGNTPIDCIPDKAQIKRAIKTYHDDYPKSNLDSYLEDDFNYSQYDEIISIFTRDTDKVLSIFNMAYQIFDDVRCYKNRVSKISIYLGELNFSNEQEQYVTLSIVKNLFNKFCSTEPTTYHCVRELERILEPIQNSFDVFKKGEKGGNCNKKSRIYLNNQRGMKLDLIRVVNALYEKGFFKDESQNKISKKEVFETFGECLNMDLSKFQNDLSRSLTDSTALEKHLKIFEDLKEKMEDIFNSR